MSERLIRGRSGFTLTELLVVISILILMVSMTAYAFNANRHSERLRNSARMLQSAIMGARDRATQAKEIRGIRFVRDANESDQANPYKSTMLTGLAFTQPVPSLKYGLEGGNAGAPPVSMIFLARENGNSAVTRLVGFGDIHDPANEQSWVNLWNRGFLKLGCAIRIPAYTGRQFQVLGVKPGPVANSSEITIADFGSFDQGYGPERPDRIAVPPDSARATCDIRLANEEMPMTLNVDLPAGAVIDLKWSRWAGLKDERLFDNRWPLELEFTPRGQIKGPQVAFGPVILCLNDSQDAIAGLNPLDKRNQGDKVLLAIYPATGQVQTFPPNLTDDKNNATGDPGPDGIPDDFFKFVRDGIAAP